MPLIFSKLRPLLKQQLRAFEIAGAARRARFGQAIDHSDALIQQIDQSFALGNRALDAPKLLALLDDVGKDRLLLRGEGPQRLAQHMRLEVGYA